MVNLKKWGITPNFTPKEAIIKIKNMGKKKARFSIVPKNKRSILLNKKATTAFKFKKKKFIHNIIGQFSFGTIRNGKRTILVSQGFTVMAEKL